MSTTSTDRRSRFGTTRQLPSGRWQASYRHLGKRWNAPATYATEAAAQQFLDDTASDIRRGLWAAPAAGGKTVAGVAAVGALATPSAPLPAGRIPTLAQYAPAWLDRRRVKGRPLAVRTREHYSAFLTREILPTFGHLQLDQITRAAVREWHNRAAAETVRAQSYAVLASIMRSAVEEDDHIEETPCTIRGAATQPRPARKDPLTAEQVMALVGAINGRYSALVAVLGFCGLRFGEAVGLKRADVDLEARTIKVRGQIVRTKAGLLAQDRPKTAAGVRTVPIPRRVVPFLRKHLAEHAGPDLVFPAATGGALAQSSFQKPLGVACKRTGIACNPHLLRHTAATLFAQQKGVNAADVQRFLGHTTGVQALHYTHSADDRLVKLAAGM